MIYINGQPLESVSSMELRSQLILSLISHGKEWLKWAIKDTGMPDVRVHSERQLLEAVQSGLHQDPYIRFKTFRAVLAKFMDLPEDQLEIFSVAAFGNGNNESVPAETLEENNILSYAELADAAAYASTMEAQVPVLFSNVSFNDLLELAPFVAQLEAIDPKLKKGAQLFAQVEASSIPEFIDLFFFFVYVTGKQAKKEGARAALQLGAVKQAYDQLMPLLNGLIFTPNLGKAGMEKLGMVVGASKSIGYETKQAAAANLAANISFAKPDETEMRMNIEKYLLEVKNIVSLAKTPKGIMRQDGRLTTLHYQQNKTSIHVGVDATGNIVLLRDTVLKQSH